MSIALNENIEKAALICYLKNNKIEFDNKLFKLAERNSIIDVIYNDTKYQITSPANEAEVLNRVINRREKLVKRKNIEGSIFEIPNTSGTPMFTSTYSPDESWHDFVIDPISRKKLDDGAGVVLLIYSSIMMSPFIDNDYIDRYREMIPSNSFDQIISVDGFRNFVIENRKI